MLKIKDMNANSVIRQGDTQPREYQLDTGNLNLNLANKQATIRLMTGDYKGIAYETTATVSSENKISFSIDDVIPAREYRLEITVDDYVFPSRATDGRFDIDPSSHGQEVNIIQIIGKDEIVREVKEQIEPFLGDIEQAELDRQAQEEARETAEGERQEEYQKYGQQFTDVITELTEERDFDSAPEIVAARRGKASLGEKIDEVTTQLAHTDSKIGETNSSVVKFPMDEYERGVHWTYNAEEIINIFFEPIRTHNPDYITKKLEGKDATGQFNIYSYTLEPENYSKTLFLTGTMHGSEVTFLGGMLDLMERLVGIKPSTSYIEFLRNNVKIIYIPILNPWGFNQTPKTRWNGNGVNINRNGAYGWESYGGTEPFGNDYKGTSPFSESESKIVKNIIDNIEIDLCVDLHNMGIQNQTSYLVITSETNPIINPINKVLKDLHTFNESSKDYNARPASFHNPIPTLYNHIWINEGIPSINMEWSDGNFGDMYSDIEINKSMENLLSVVKAIFNYMDNANSKEVVELKENIYMKYYYWNNTTERLTITSPAQVELPEFKIELRDVELENCYVEADFTFMISTDTPSALTHISARVEGTGDLKGATVSPATVYTNSYASGSERLMITVRAVGFVPKTATPRIRFYGSTSAGTVDLKAVRGVVKQTRNSKNNLKNINGSGKENNPSGSVFI